MMVDRKTSTKYFSKLCRLLNYFDLKTNLFSFKKRS